MARLLHGRDRARNRPRARALAGEETAYEGTMSDMAPVTMYTTPWCGYCRRLKRQLEDEGIEFREIDVDVESAYDARIVAATGGFRTVPTLEVGDRLLVNPTLPEVRAALAASN